MKTALVIMAAGIGSRFGGGIKQLAAVGPNGEIIMDYSIHDALEAGFNKIIFIIRKDLEKDFKEIVGDRISKVIKTEYVYQELDRLPDGYCVPSERTKPWGTGHAVLMCRDVVKEPFAVINADDFYGEEPYRIIHDELVNPVKSGLTLAPFPARCTTCGSSERSSNLNHTGWSKFGGWKRAALRKRKLSAMR